MKRIVALFILLALGCMQATYADKSTDEFQDALRQLQQSPDDKALREAVIGAAQKLKSLPKIPEDARRALARGAAAFETAQSAADYLAATVEFGAAMNAAPWWSDPYFNRSLAFEKAGSLAQAAAAIHFYLLAAPNAPDADAMQTKQYKLEYLAEQKSKAEAAAAAAQARANQQRQQSAAVLNELKAMVAAVNYDRGDCHTQMVDRGDGAQFADGCTWAEYSGRNWHSDRALEGNFVFDFSDAAVVRLGFKGYGRNALAFTDLVGTPNGPTLNDMQWECPVMEWNGTKSVEKGRKPAWVRFSSDIRWFGWTCETTDPSANPTVKYHYASYKAQ